MVGEGNGDGPGACAEVECGLGAVEAESGGEMGEELG